MREPHGKDHNQEKKSSSLRHAFGMAAMLPAGIVLAATFGPVALIAGTFAGVAAAGFIRLNAAEQDISPGILRRATVAGMMAAGAGVLAVSPTLIIPCVLAAGSMALAFDTATKAKASATGKNEDEAKTVYKETLTGTLAGAAFGAALSFFTVGQQAESFPPPPSAPAAPEVRSEVSIHGAKTGHMSLGGYNFSVPAAA